MRQKLPKCSVASHALSICLRTSSNRRTCHSPGHPGRPAGNDRDSWKVKGERTELVRPVCRLSITANLCIRPPLTNAAVSAISSVHGGRTTSLDAQDISKRYYDGWRHTLVATSGSWTGCLGTCWQWRRHLATGRRIALSTRHA